MAKFDIQILALTCISHLVAPSRKGLDDFESYHSRPGYRSFFLASRYSDIL
jgi:hypothetical protein